MSEEEARALINSLSSEQKIILLQLLRQLDTVQTTAEAYEAGLQAKKRR